MPKAEPTYFVVDGLEPADDPRWIYATKPQKAAFMRVCRTLVLTEWDKQTEAGLGANGRKLAPIKPSTRMHRHSEMGPADPDAPPLQPAHSLSRTRSLVDAKAIGLTIRVFWKFDPISGKRWGTILGYHRDGRGHLPVRDVMGLSAARKKAVIKAALLWWAGYAGGGKVVMPVRPRPGKAARPPVAIHLPRKPKDLPVPAAARPFVPKGVDVSIGADIYSGSRMAASQLLGAIKSGAFSGFRSYE